MFWPEPVLEDTFSYCVHLWAQASPRLQRGTKVEGEAVIKRLVGNFRGKMPNSVCLFFFF